MAANNNNNADDNKEEEEPKGPTAWEAFSAYYKASDREELTNVCFDLFTMGIAVCDVVTDILVAASFYDLRRWSLFWCSVAIFITAHFMYTIYFLFTFSRASFFRNVIYFIVYLPLSPFTGEFFLLLEKSSWVRSKLEKYDIKAEFWAENKTVFSGDGDEDVDQPSGAFFSEKAKAHTGFIMEALFEAFPQSILQLISIVYYDELSVLSLLSIMLSLLSVCSKTLLFSHSLRMTTYICFWLCFVSDAILLFCTITWLFHRGRYDHVLTYIWVVKFVLIDMPSALWYAVFIVATMRMERAYNSIRQKIYFGQTLAHDRFAEAQGQEQPTEADLTPSVWLFEWIYRSIYGTNTNDDDDDDNDNQNNNQNDDDNDDDGIDEDALGYRTAKIGDGCCKFGVKWLSYLFLSIALSFLFCVFFLVCCLIFGLCNMSAVPMSIGDNEHIRHESTHFYAFVHDFVYHRHPVIEDLHHCDNSYYGGTKMSSLMSRWFERKPRRIRRYLRLEKENYILEKRHKSQMSGKMEMKLKKAMEEELRKRKDEYTADENDEKKEDDKREEYSMLEDEKPVLVSSLNEDDNNDINDDDMEIDQTKSLNTVSNVLNSRNIYFPAIPNPEEELAEWKRENNIMDDDDNDDEDEETEPILPLIEDDENDDDNNNDSNSDSSSSGMVVYPDGTVKDGDSSSKKKKKSKLSTNKTKVKLPDDWATGKLNDKSAEPTVVKKVMIDLYEGMEDPSVYDGDGLIRMFVQNHSNAKGDRLCSLNACFPTSNSGKSSAMEHLLSDAHAYGMDQVSVIPYRRHTSDFNHNNDNDDFGDIQKSTNYSSFKTGKDLILLTDDITMHANDDDNDKKWEDDKILENDDGLMEPRTSGTRAMIKQRKIHDGSNARRSNIIKWVERPAMTGSVHRSGLKRRSTTYFERKFNEWMGHGSDVAFKIGLINTTIAEILFEEAIHYRAIYFHTLYDEFEYQNMQTHCVYARHPVQKNSIHWYTWKEERQHEMRVLPVYETCLMSMRDWREMFHIGWRLDDVRSDLNWNKYHPHRSHSLSFGNDLSWLIYTEFGQYIMFPLKMMSIVFSVLFPLICVCYYGLDFSNKGTNLLQSVLTLVYLSMLGGIVLLAIPTIEHLYIVLHLWTLDFFDLKQEKVEWRELKSRVLMRYNQFYHTVIRDVIIDEFIAINGSDSDGDGGTEVSSNISDMIVDYLYPIASFSLLDNQHRGEMISGFKSGRLEESEILPGISHDLFS